MNDDTMKTLIGISYVGPYIGWVIYFISKAPISATTDVLWILFGSLFVAAAVGFPLHLAFTTVFGESNQDASIAGRIFGFFAILCVLGLLLWVPIFSSLFE